MPSLPHRPALASRDGISSFSSVQSSDSYYSNAEIRVLHDVVAVAQDNLDDLPEGERLATNALFQAYDAVLPNYGIDPEEDHHISRLVFRVGGERGDGSLLEKLHNVLSRMGIELEFDNPSDGSRPVSDQCDEAEREMASQPSRPFSDAGHDSVTTEDESSENFQLPQEDRHKSSSASFDSDRHPCPPRLTRTALAPNLSAHGSGQQREEPISRSYSPPTAAGTEQTRQSSQLGVDTSRNRGPNGATVRPVDTVAPYPEENENLASSLPVRTKPVRTVNWLLPEDAADTEPSNGHGSVTTEHRAQSQSSQQQYQLYKQPQQSQQYQHRLLQQQHIPNEHDGRSMPSHLYQSYQKVEELEQEQRVSQQQHSLYHSLPQIWQVLPQQAVPQQENANEPKLQQQPFREYQHPQQPNQPPYVPVIEHQIQHAQFQQDQQELVSAGSVPDHDAIQHKENSSAGRRQKAEELSSSDVKDFGQEATNNEQQLAEKPPETEPELDVRGVSADEEMEEDPEAEARYAWMRAVLPGRPRSGHYALATGFWDSRHFNIYITGCALAILRDSDTIVQTIYDDDPTHLQAVAFDESTGKIATCTDTTVRVYRPFGQSEDALKWGLQSSFPIPESQNAIDGTSLSWGASEELLVAHSALYMYLTSNETIQVWKKSLPNPSQFAELSYDSGYIASVGFHDRLVKAWRRLTYGAEEVRFDLAYLRHPDVVTSIRWRKPYHIEQTVENVLYTICADNLVRVWTGSDTHAPQQLKLWGAIDLASSFRDQSLTNRHPATPLIAFVLDGREVSAATEVAVQRRSSQNGKQDTALEHLISLANDSVELCIASSGGGDTVVFALEDVGPNTSKSRNSNISRFKSQYLDFRPEQHAEVHSYCDRRTGRLHVLIHDFDGQIQVYETDLVDFLNPSAKQPSLTRHCIWSGHSAPIQKMVRNFSGRAVVSRTAEGESIVWTHAENSKSTLSRQSIIPGSGQILRICVLRKGRFVIFLERNTICLWDCRGQRAILLERQSYEMSGKPLCLVILPRQRLEEYAVAHIASVTSEQEGIVWEVNLPRYSRQGPETHVNGRAGTSIREFCRFRLEGIRGLAYVLPVDPAGSALVTSGFLDVFAKDIAISYTHTGRVDFWTSRVDSTEDRVGWLSTSSAETGLSEPALVSGSTLKKAALVDSTRSQLFIWDIGGARLEFTQNYGTNNTIQDLDWTSTPDSQSILAVGFQSKVVLLCQMRFDYLNKGPAWAAVREISIRELTPHPIGDSTWLGDGYLVIGSGNQMFVHDRAYDLSGSLVKSLQLPHRKNGVWDLFDAVQRFNGPLPVFHPQFLSQSILAGKNAVVRKILMSLFKILKFHVADETVDDYLGLDLADFYKNETSSMHASESHLGSHFSLQTSGDDAEETFTEDVAYSINERLTKVDLQQLSGHEQIQLADIIECVGMVEKQRRSLDENGARFMLFFRQHALRKGRTSEIQMSWREINWAYHSISQDILVDFVSKQCHGSVRWEDARESGMFMWLSDHNALRTQFENVARNEYTKSDTKNPVDCSLYYLALKKKTILQGLWRMAYGNREQAATQRFLANNFDDPEWRTKALKNAYALLSKRRFEYAAAFFLLADHLQDAVNICLKQLKDIQLAVAIARVYEGDQGPVLRKLLEEEILAVAAKEGNRWLASWAFWMLNRKDMAVRALISPVYTLVETPCTPDLQSKLFLTDDPALVVLYSQLRQKTLQTLRGASKVTPRVEWEFVLHSAKLYDRMGCDLLGLDLVRNWEFLKPATSSSNGLGGEINPLKLLRRRSSLVVADLPMSSLHMEMRSGGKKGKASTPTVFQEPDSSSLLDSFGF
ncbi:WD repeat protein [Colletotrichum karsti]|uniref:WD repeat protein n=1 Tax=Colletotrichum karsti TaxID=1095194 RepID=A0A9P6LDN9_9PEZI|nr:WD repeat protein [Colletotrichum karsti]KAF9869323.1 WD repeat protein [Colletotrichum karsti]